MKGILRLPGRGDPAQSRLDNTTPVPGAILVMRLIAIFQWCGFLSLYLLLGIVRVTYRRSERIKDLERGVVRVVDSQLEGAIGVG